MKLIFLNGSSCAGKSTTVKNIMAKKDKLYQLSYDSQKWQFSQYTREKYSKDVFTLVREILKAVCAMRYQIIADCGLWKEDRESLIAIAKEHGYEVIEINLEAPYDVLAKRFDERVANALAKPGSRIANTSTERFKEIYDIYEAEKNPNALTLFTDKEENEKIIEKILPFYDEKNT